MVNEALQNKKKTKRKEKNQEDIPKPGSVPTIHQDHDTSRRRCWQQKFLEAWACKNFTFKLRISLEILIRVDD